MRGVTRWVGIWGLSLASAGCGGGPPIADCPASGAPGNAGGLYFTHSYRFESAADCFAATFPAPPRLTEQGTRTLAGTITERSYTATTTVDYYLVGVVHLPWLVAVFGPTHTILDKLRDEFLAQESAKELGYVDVSVDGHPGKLLTFLRKSGDRGLAHLVALEHRVYLIVGQSTVKDDAAEKFLASFAFDKACLARL